MSFKPASLPIAVKLPLIILALILISNGINTYLSYVESSQALVSAQKDKLQALTEARKDAAKNYLVSIEEDIKITAQSDHVQNALINYTRAWDELVANGIDPTEYLTKLYVTNNTEQDKAKLEDAG